MSEKEDLAGIITHDDEEDMFPDVPYQDYKSDPEIWAEEQDLTGHTSLWHPDADRSIPMRIKGRYANGYPVGAVIHATVGRTQKGDYDAENTIKGGAHKHLYFCISSTGKLYQPAPLSRWGIHAGRSYAAGLGNSLDNKLVGIEICNAGIVVKHGSGFKANGWNEKFRKDEVRYTDKVSNVTKAGNYHKYNAKQEKVLIDLLLWLKANNPSVFQLAHVYGHDEVAINKQGKLGRKKDPGGSLSSYMPEFRKMLLSKALTS